CLYVTNQPVFQPSLLQSRFVPHLKSLGFRCSGEDPFGTLNITDIDSRLRFLKVDASVDLLPIVAQLDSIKSLIVTGVWSTTLRKVLEQLPQLERLSLGRTFITATTDGIKAMEEYIETFLPLQGLTHLGGLFSNMDYQSPLGEDIIRMVSVLPSLRYVEVWNTDVGRSTWLTIRRNSAGEYDGIEVIKDIRNVMTSNWSGFFRGFVKVSE
ncbi:hypothetical protein M422DRAFT_57048, partial [Sphaerobolus stellatus SS14]